MNTSVTDIAYEFRCALETALASAEPILKKNPQLIDQAVYGDSESALHFFAVENRIDIVTWLLARGANPDGISADGFPLHESAQLGNTEICRILIEAGANLNRQDSLGETALHKACSHGHLEIIEFLLASGADPTVREMCGELPIDQSPPRKRPKSQAIFDRHALQSRNEET